MKQYKKGQKIGRLKVVSVRKDNRPKKNGHKCSKPLTLLDCICDCGNLITITASDTRGKRNCGCRYGNTKYIKLNRKLYTTWRSMKNRCFWVDCPNYNDYGGRGITVCVGMKDFETYQKVVGEPPSKKHSVDRIDNNMHYSCGECSECIKNGWGNNVKWSTRKEQNSNKRNNIFVQIDNVIFTLKEACKIKNLPYKQIHERIVRGGWDINVAINTPINKFNRYKSFRNETSYRKKHRNI